jgi:carboxylesterase
LKKPYGVLILHGLSASLDCVNGLEPPLRELGLPIRMPVLRGHGAASPEALNGVKWQDWVSDGEAALHGLLAEVDRAIIFGHSMGGLVALNLAASMDGQVDSIILAAPALVFDSPLADGKPLSFLTPLIPYLVKKWKMPPDYADPSLAENNTNYPWIPIESVMECMKMQKATRGFLPKVQKPLFILGSRQDPTVDAKSVEIITQEVSTSPDQQRVDWFEKSKHEMFRDCECDCVIQSVVDYVKGRTSIKKEITNV